MSNELQAFALRSTISEIKKACPDVSHAFIFTEDGLLQAADDDTDEETAAHIMKTVKALSTKSNTIGGIESVTFYTANKQLNVFHLNDRYLGVVGSMETDEKTSSDLARIIVPTVIGLTEKITEFLETNATVDEPKVQDELNLAVKETGTELKAEEITLEAVSLDELSETEEPQSQLPEPPVTQFMVEDLAGIFALSDTLRIDSSVILQWKDLYGERKISEVDVETLNGTMARCKFRPIKDSKHNGKGTIQLPQKIQRILQTTKGELVTVTPVIE